MAALHSRCGHYILPCGFFFLSFFPRLISPAAIRCLPYLHTWCGLSANLGCRSETCCTVHAARWKCRTRKIAKNSPSGHHRTTLSGYIFATKARIDNRKKIVTQQYVFQMFPQYGELRPTSSWDRFVSLGHPCKFQLVSRLGSVTARHSSSGRQPNFAAFGVRQGDHHVGHWPTFLVC